MKIGVNKNKALRAPQRGKSSKSPLSCGSRAKLAAGFGAALFILAVLATSLGFREVRFIATTIDQIGALVLTLALVAVVIERAVEVFVSKSYDPEKLRVTRPVARAEAKLAKAEKLLAEERERRHGSTRVPTDAEEAEFQQLIQVAQHAQQQCDAAEDGAWQPLSRLKASKLRAASYLSLLLGALASFSGVRVLGQFLPVDAQGNLSGSLALSTQVLQLGAFRLTDSVLSALLLAGGAAGIHRMVSSIKTFRSPGGSSV